MEGEKVLLGIILGAALAFLILNRNTYTEVVRDDSGRIIQIVEMRSSGRMMYNSITPLNRISLAPQ